MDCSCISGAAWPAPRARHLIVDMPQPVPDLMIDHHRAISRQVAASRHPHVRAGIPTIIVDNHIVAHTAAVLLRTYRRERRQGRRLGEHDIEIAIAVRRRFENRACAPIHVRCSEYETRHSKNLRLIRLHHWWPHSNDIAPCHIRCFAPFAALSQVFRFLIVHQRGRLLAKRFGDGVFLRFRRFLR